MVADKELHAVNWWLSAPFHINCLIGDQYTTLTDQSDFAKILDDIRDVVKAPTAAAAREIF